VALDADSEGSTEVEDLGVLHPQFARQLVDADVLRHGGLDVLLLDGDAAVARPAGPTGR